jgi:hypothetical protein
MDQFAFRGLIGEESYRFKIGASGYDSNHYDPDEKKYTSNNKWGFGRYGLEFDDKRNGSRYFVKNFQVQSSFVI